LPAPYWPDVASCGDEPEIDATLITAARPILHVRQSQSHHPHGLSGSVPTPHASRRHGDLGVVRPSENRASDSIIVGIHEAAGATDARESAPTACTRTSIPGPQFVRHPVKLDVPHRNRAAPRTTSSDDVAQPGVSGACSRVLLQMMPPRSPIVTPP
jgi:hypothetical protein